MTYYLLLSGDSEQDALYDTNVLGEESFETFYPSVGFIILNRIINQQPELLESLQILDEQKKLYTITEFLDKLEFFEDKREELKRMGKSAKELISNNFIYDKDNLLLKNFLKKIFKKLDI